MRLLGIPCVWVTACATGEVLERQPRGSGTWLDGGDDAAFDWGGTGGGGPPAGGFGGGTMASPPPGVSAGGSAGSGTGGSGEGGLGDGAAEDAGGGSPNDGCDPAMKRCGGICVLPSFDIGCGMDDCEPCPDPPPNSQGFCGADGCSFLCSGGYELNASEDGCEPVVVGSGGAGGTGGSPSTGGSGGGGGCIPTSCTLGGCGFQDDGCGGNACTPCPNGDCCTQDRQCQSGKCRSVSFGQSSCFFSTGYRCQD